MKKKEPAVKRGLSLITHTKPKSIISEKFRGIRTNIMFSTADSEVKSVVVTSEKPSSGKSTISANLAITYAQAGFNTLLIDGDMRKPTQHYQFNKNNIEGLSKLIIKKSDYEKSILDTGIPNLHLLTSGPIPPYPSELIGSVNFSNIFEELKGNYDFIVIDTPPVNTVTDAQLFAEIAKHVVYVVDSKKSNRDDVKRGKELLEKAGAKILGVVLNKATPEKTSSYYYYYGEESK